MRSRVKLPRVAETVDEVVVEEWSVAPGSTIAVGDVLMTVETDKAIVEVPSPVAGLVVELLVSPGDEIATGHHIALVDVQDA